MLYEVITWLTFSFSPTETAKHVITSYSIHYTKLYENPLKQKTGGEQRRQHRRQTQNPFGGTAGQQAYQGSGPVKKRSYNFV